MVTIQSLDNSLLFTFTNSNHYFQNGKVEVPKNSLALIVDDSDMASFRKSASNDIFISATYDELGMSKAELISWFEENGFSEGGDLDDYYTKEETNALLDESISGKADSSAVTEEISAAVSGKADTSALTAYFDGAEYNSNNKTIEFYNNGVLKDSIDATDFIKDGMVDSVTVEDITSGGTTVNCLVITFNTDSGKENINIPIKDIFDSDLYYDKTATDGLLANKLDVSSYTAYTSSTETTINGKASQTDLETVSGAVDTKLNISDFNTYSGGVNTAITAIEGDITNVQTALNGKANASDLTALETVVGGKLNTSDFNTYTAATETTINGKASQTDLETVSGAVDTLSGQVADKADTTAMTQALADKLDISTFETFSGSVDTALSGKASQTDLEIVSGNVDTISGDVETINLALADKANTTAVTEAISEAVSGKTDLSAFTSFTSSTETALSGKASQSDLNTLSGDVANKLDISTFTAYSASVDTTLQGKADASDLANYVETSAYTAYTSSTDTALQGKQNTLTAGTNISISNDVISVTGITSQTVTSVTQAEYDSLTTKNPDTFYIISDATGGTITIDPSLNSGSTNAVANSAITIAIDAKADTTAMTQALSSKVDTSTYTAYTAATDTALNGKQATLVSGTNIKTVNGNSLLGSGDIEIQVSVDSALDSGSTNAVANSAITKAIQDNELVVANALIALQDDVDTVSAATASNTTALGGYSLWKGTQVQYDAIVTKDEDTIYFIVNNS